jgi:hypothetical protein
MTNNKYFLRFRFNWWRSLVRIYWYILKIKQMTVSEQIRDSFAIPITCVTYGIFPFFLFCCLSSSSCLFTVSFSYWPISQFYLNCDFSKWKE